MENNSNLDFIIAVKNRDNGRIQRCIDSFKSISKEIVVVDYGSEIPVEVKDAKIIRYEGSKIWNKSHALNLGIKATSSEFICTIDCDMILSEELLIQIRNYLNKDNVLFNTNVRRIEIENLSDNFEDMLKKSSTWFEKGSRSNIYSAANGGIQVFPRWWIEHIGGYDEGLGIYWGAMDNRIYEQAKMTNMCLIDLNYPMLHQEHPEKKEDNLPEDERKFANLIRAYKIEYLKDLHKKNNAISKRAWGGEYPNHKWMIDLVKVWEQKILVGVKVYIAIVTNYDHLPIYFVMNLLGIINDARSKGIPCDVYNFHAPAVDSIRNYSVLQAKNEGYTHILQLDTDHTYPEDLIIRLLSHKKEFVCGVTTRKVMPYTQTQFYEVDLPLVNSPGNRCEFKGEEGLVKIEGTGMVGSMIDLKIFEKIEFPFYDRIYDLRESKVKETGEDIYFCRQLKKAGIPIYCDTSLSYPHQVPNAFADRGELIIQ